MRELEAAAYLEVSARTLRNYRSKGILAYSEVKGKTRPEIEYEAVDVDRLKAQLEVKRNSSTKSKEAKPKTSKQQRITLGLSPNDYAEFSVEAARYGMSASEYARRLVREGLDSRFRSEAAELRGEVKRLSIDLERVQRDFTAAFEVVLEYAGLDAESARKWVTENLR